MPRSQTTAPRAFRYEPFGGIVQLERPRGLVFIDRERARSLGYVENGAWHGPEADCWPPALLSAPLEAHLQLTNRCTAGCQGCYTAATPEGAAGEYDEVAWRRAIDVLAEAGVFHLALGGGESAHLPWLGALARYARARGLVPNLTTSGLLDDGELDRLRGWAPLFGQINVSLDGLGEYYRKVRGFDGFAQVDRTIVALRKATRHVGINCVVTRENFDGLSDLFAYARKRRLREIELLRFKPSGRGIRSYERLCCSQSQHRAILPLVLRLSRKHHLRVRLDCSYTPMVAYHRIRPELMSFLAIYGCAGGDMLVGAKASGALTPCSFATPEPGIKVDELGKHWHAPQAFSAFRQWKEAAEEPCRSCEYLALCRGGCRVVSGHLCGDLTAPDPECPKVVDCRGHHGTRLPRREALPVIA